MVLPILPPSHSAVRCSLFVSESSTGVAYPVGPLPT
ncbi:uncharacterized protein CTRU02_200138 [Colletotrichum truncatum]|uniref:Uncharacterized protein n=1 Tax=Colletotrichum truncatum TaxID=5467 RepID=A0ACC3ZDQ5_COLTU|nr:uncharacterized protein CTRU02_05015 [Colletotrichum truncatum]KAF6794814.1 hypothetical protein CTRU02_05015 [Colletotrichum truncatum]